MPPVDFQTGLRCSRVTFCVSKIRSEDVVTKSKPEFEEFRNGSCVDGQITLMLRQTEDREAAETALARWDKDANGVCPRPL